MSPARSLQLHHKIDGDRTAMLSFRLHGADDEVGELVAQQTVRADCPGSVYDAISRLCRTSVQLGSAADGVIDYFAAQAAARLGLHQTAGYRG